MSYNPVDDLRMAVTQGQVVAIVGAGVSIEASGNDPRASWTGLLEDGIARCEAIIRPLPTGWGERARGEISSKDLGEMLSAAEKISDRLGAPSGGEWRKWLRESVGELKPKNPAVLETLRDLKIPIATTNYDDMLAQVSGLEPVTWNDHPEVERILHGDRKAILHLHGVWRKAESVVLGIRSYEKILGDAHAQTMLRTLRAARTLLFVGCGGGLEDPNLGALLRWTHGVFAESEYRDYRLCLDTEVDDLQRQHPREERILVLGYGPSHEHLAPFLRTLFRTPGNGPPNTVATSPPLRRVETVHEEAKPRRNEGFERSKDASQIGRGQKGGDVATALGDNRDSGIPTFVATKFGTPLHRHLQRHLQRFPGILAPQFLEFWPGFIFTHLLHEMQDRDPLILFDISKINCNVSFELGLAIGLNRPGFPLIEARHRVLPELLKGLFYVPYRLRSPLGEGFLTAVRQTWLAYQRQREAANFIHMFEWTFPSGTIPQEPYLVAIGHNHLQDDREFRRVVEAAASKNNMKVKFIWDTNDQLLAQPNVYSAPALTTVYTLLRHARVVIARAEKIETPIRASHFIAIGIARGLKEKLGTPHLLLCHRERSPEGQEIEPPSDLLGLHSTVFDPGKLQSFTSRLGDLLRSYSPTA